MRREPRVFVIAFLHFLHYLLSVPPSPFCLSAFFASLIIDCHPLIRLSHLQEAAKEAGRAKRNANLLAKQLQEMRENEVTKKSAHLLLVFFALLFVHLALSSFLSLVSASTFSAENERIEYLKAEKEKIDEKTQSIEDKMRPMEVRRGEISTQVFSHFHSSFPLLFSLFSLLFSPSFFLPSFFLIFPPLSRLSLSTHS